MNDEDVGTEEELIDLVKACPILYDVRLKVYKDRNMKDSAWHSISEAMKLSGKKETQMFKNDHLSHPLPYFRFLAFKSRIRRY